MSSAPAAPTAFAGRSTAAAGAVFAPMHNTPNKRRTTTTTNNNNKAASEALCATCLSGLEDMGFGQYADTTRRAVFESDPSYVCWARDTPTPSRALSAFVDYCDARDVPCLPPCASCPPRKRAALELPPIFLARQPPESPPQHGWSRARDRASNQLDGSGKPVFGELDGDAAAGICATLPVFEEPSRSTRPRAVVNSPFTEANRAACGNGHCFYFVRLGQCNGCHFHHPQLQLETLPAEDPQQPPGTRATPIHTAHGLVPPIWRKRLLSIGFRSRGLAFECPTLPLADARQALLSKGMCDTHLVAADNSASSSDDAAGQVSPEADEQPAAAPAAVAAAPAAPSTCPGCGKTEPDVEALGDSGVCRDCAEAASASAAAATAAPTPSNKTCLVCGGAAGAFAEAPALEDGGLCADCAQAAIAAAVTTVASTCPACGEINAEASGLSDGGLCADCSQAAVAADATTAANTCPACGETTTTTTTTASTLSSVCSNSLCADCAPSAKRLRLEVKKEEPDFG